MSDRTYIHMRRRTSAERNNMQWLWIRRARVKCVDSLGFDTYSVQGVRWHVRPIILLSVRLVTEKPERAAASRRTLYVVGSARDSPSRAAGGSHKMGAPPHVHHPIPSTDCHGWRWGRPDGFLATPVRQKGARRKKNKKSFKPLASSIAPMPFVRCRTRSFRIQNSKLQTWRSHDSVDGGEPGGAECRVSS